MASSDSTTPAWSDLKMFGFDSSIFIVVPFVIINLSHSWKNEIHIIFFAR
jgi:hypothetical protein